MDLWIRSQDKNILLKVDKIEICHNYTQKVKYENYLPKGSISYDSMKTVTTYVNDKYIDSNIYVNGIELGTYKSKERALKVLDEIQNILNLKDMYKYDRELVLKSWENFDEKQVKIAIQQMSIYEMPKE